MNARALSWLSATFGALCAALALLSMYVPIQFVEQSRFKIDLMAVAAGCTSILALPALRARKRVGYVPYYEELTLGALTLASLLPIVPLVYTFGFVVLMLFGGHT